MAKYNSSNKIAAIKLGNDLPDYAQGLQGEICTLVGVHFNSGGFPLFTTPEHRFEDRKYMFFHEGHIDQFIYVQEDTNV